MHRLILFVLTVCSFSGAALAELEELDDKKLKDQEAKAGITIDIESQLSIGEMYLDMHDRSGKEKARRNYMPQAVAPITYDLPKNK